MTSPDIVVGVLRLVAAALAAYLCVITLVGLAARVMGAHVLRRAVDRITPALLRRVLGSLLGASLAVPTVVHAQEAPAPVVMHRIDDDTAAATPPAEVPPESRAIPRDSTDGSPVDVDAAVGDMWTVKPGEHFWAIAKAVVAQHVGHAPSNRETAVYWLALVERNRSALRDPGNADLIYPGQVFQLPAFTE